MITDLPCYYNVLIITFANLNEQGQMDFDIQGPYENDLELMKTHIAEWKKGSDPYGRERLALFSMGGQNGKWPAGLTELQVETAISDFIDAFSLDGLDVDLEGHAVEEAKTMLPAIKTLTTQGYVVTAAPEASQGPLNGYDSILLELDWLHPQFYNNPPNAVTTPWSPICDWSAPDGNYGPPKGWQDETPACYNLPAGTPWWYAVLDAITQHKGMGKHTQGMLMPATKDAANSYNDWDITRLRAQVDSTGVQHVGTWAIAYDNKNDYKFASEMASIMDADIKC